MASQALIGAAAVAVILLTIVEAVTGQSAWTSGATATYYGGSDAGGTNQGACGYGNQIPLYGTMTTALSAAFFQNANTCGACYEIRCTGTGYCKSGTSVVVTATNLCPSGSNGGWCDGSNQHFDLAQPAFDTVAQEIVGHFVAQYRRVPCVRSGGVRFTLNGNSNWLLVLISNVAGAGNVVSATIKGSNNSPTPMSRNWGENWQYSGALGGQAITFTVQLSDGTSRTFPNVCPSNWQLGQTCTSSVQF